MDSIKHSVFFFVVEFLFGSLLRMDEWRNLSRKVAEIHERDSYTGELYRHDALDVPAVDGEQVPQTSSEVTPWINEKWMEKAACRGIAEIFFPIGTGALTALKQKRAEQICDGCRVRQQCDDYGMRQEKRDPAWYAGSSQNERKKRRKRMAS